jgi:CP family cyanate transporter-like MFS transporter
MPELQRFQKKFSLQGGVDNASIGQLLFTLAALWLMGAAMRVTLLAIPPVLPQLQPDLSLSQTDVGILSSLPPLLFAFMAIPGAALIARFGILRTLICGLLLTAAAGALRGISANVPVLFATTFVMSAGIAAVQPAVPSIVRAWMPQRIGFATAVYSNGMLSSEALAAALTLPFILPLVGGSWRWGLVFWSLPVILAVFLILLRDCRGRAGETQDAPAVIQTRRWWPDWRDPLTWQLGIVMGGASGVYFSVNGFLPGYLTGTGRADLITGALAALNISQIPATIILMFFAQKISTKRFPYIVTGLVAAGSVAGLIVLPGAWAVPCSAVIGFCCATFITLSLTLPALLAAHGDVHRLSSGMFTVGYGLAVVTPIVGGLAWDISVVPAAAFVPAGVFDMAVAVLGTRLFFSGASAKA